MELFIDEFNPLPHLSQTSRGRHVDRATYTSTIKSPSSVQM